MRLGVVLLASIVLMTIDHRFAYLESVRAALSVLVYPVQYAVNLPVAGVRWVSESVVTQRRLLHENERLRSENLLLQSRFQRFAAIEAENSRLRRLLESSTRSSDRVLVADLLAIELQPVSRQVVLNKGTTHGVYMGQPVVDASGVMGQIVHVGPLSSTAMLITDPSHALPVEINRTGLRAVAIGTGDDQVLELSYVPINADLREGDLVVTSGMGGRFPRGYPVGEVARIDLDPGQPFARVLARPSARLTQSHEVLLVWPPQMTEVRHMIAAPRPW